MTIIDYRRIETAVARGVFRGVFWLFVLWLAICLIAVGVAFYFVNRAPDGSITLPNGSRIGVHP